MMVQSISKSITTLRQVYERFGLQRTESDRFFTEWFEDLPALSEPEKARLDQIKRRYEYQNFDEDLLEETIKMLVVSPLLDLAGFYEPPFRFKAEMPVSFELEAAEESIRGRMDALVIQQQFWVLLVEAKYNGASIDVGIPQLLAYMACNPFPDRPVFGMVTNGGSFAFIKVIEKKYDFSDVYSLIPRRNQLYDVLMILKKIGAMISAV